MSNYCDIIRFCVNYTMRSSDFVGDQKFVVPLVLWSDDLCINDWHTDLETPMTIFFIPKYGTTSVYVLVLLCGVVNHFSLFKFVLTSYIEFYTQWMMKKLHTCTHTKVWFKMSSAGFVGHTDINRTEGVFFSTWHVILTHYTDFCFRILVFVVGNSNTLQLLKLWFEQATIIEAMVSQD